MVQIVEGPATAVGHYSAAAIGAGLVFVSGQGPKAIAVAPQA